MGTATTRREFYVTYVFKRLQGDIARVPLLTHRASLVAWPALLTACGESATGVFAEGSPRVVARALIAEKALFGSSRLERWFGKKASR